MWAAGLRLAVEQRASVMEMYADNTVELEGCVPKLSWQRRLNVLHVIDLHQPSNHHTAPEDVMMPCCCFCPILWNQQHT